VQRARRPSPDVEWAWRRLRATGGLLPVGSLARELGCSRRHLIGRFREQIGPAPKTAARLVRFQRTVRLLERHDRGRFAEIAQRCGYYDQAHMNREFRQLAGTAPGELVARLLPGGLGVAAD
jgi:transcriptional regulator GlxA family with amidase domain